MEAFSDVLVVDDDADMAELLLMLLAEAGYDARSAANGREALAAVDERMPALILLDMLMPVMNGWQCASELRNRYGRTVPIIVVTAAEHARSRSDEIGADGVLSKPFELQDLLNLVARYVQPVREPSFTLIAERPSPAAPQSRPAR